MRTRVRPSPKITRPVLPAVLAVLLAFILLSAPSAAPAAPDGPLQPSGVGLKNFRFDARKGEPQVPPGLEGRPPAPGKASFTVIKFKDGMDAPGRERLRGEGVRFYGYVPVNAYLAKVPYGMRAAVASDPAVGFTADYRPAYRLDSEPLAWAVSNQHGRKKLILQAFDGEDLAPIESAIESMGGTYEVMSDGPGLNEKILMVEVDIKDLKDLASLDGVLWIEEYKPPKPSNDMASPVIKADYAWGQAVPMTGTGQVVAVCDTGLDTGNISTVHADFSGNTSDGHQKIKQTFSYGRPGNWSDPTGHGTHTCGTALGFGVKSNQLSPGTFLRGMAYDAQLVMQSVADSSGNLIIPDLVTVVFPDAYNAGARVHSNSWGSPGSAGAYSTYSVAADTYTWSHKDFLILFAAGNDGKDANSDGVVDLGSIESPSTAKNTLSVGASENNRPAIATTYNTAIPGSFPYAPISNDKMADNTGGMAAFSSRGPCQDGRIKPDIVAPGSYVLSTKSSVATAFWINPSKYGYSSALDPYYTFMSGTSMATPAASGAAAIVREYLAAKGVTSPSAALVKGLLINGAHDMTPGQYPAPQQDVTARPDNNQGWGRIDLRETLYPSAPERSLFDDHAAGLATGGSASYTYPVQGSVPVRVSLVWTDYPGTASVSPNLVNDLDLSVTAPDGRVYHGNQYNGSASIANTPSFDRLNNVEGVTIPSSSMTAGTLTVSVQAHNVPFGPQAYALVVSGAFSDPPAVSGVSPVSGFNNVATPVTVSGQNFAAGARVFVGTSECQVGSVTANSIAATVPAGLSAGAKDVKVLNPDAQYGVLAGGFLVVQDTVAPAAPQGLVASPGDSSINVRWTPNAEPDLAGYRIYFSGYSTTSGTTSSMKLASLTNGQQYDISVRAFDGAGNFSPSSATVSATPLAANPELPHYNWDGSSDWTCAGCHVSGTKFLQGFDYKTDSSFCLGCHNSAGVAHGKPINGRDSHKMLVAAGSGNSKLPVYGTVTSGEYSDTMYTHLKGGSLLVCTTCHNVMRKPGDVGRAWEFTTSSGGTAFTAFRGGWWDQPHMRPDVYYDTSLWAPTYTRDRESKKVDAGTYSFNEYSGTVTFTNQDTINAGGYVYLTLDAPYLRVPGSDNTVCLDCHSEATHKAQSCLACHGAHGVTNIKGIKPRVRKTGGTYRDVVFARFTGVNSFAGETAKTGICEVCHTSTLYYRFDGSGSPTHADGVNYNRKDCTACHSHSTGFAR